MTLTSLYILIVFMIIAAFIAVETYNLLSAVICVGAIGFGGSLMFLFLRAPDIAITQIVVEVLGLIILIRSTISRDRAFITGDREFFQTIVSIVIVFLILFIGIHILIEMPKFGSPAFADPANVVAKTGETASQTYLREGLEKTGAANIVASVILDYRAYDTLGEATVLFASIIGATVILRTKSRKKLEEIDL